MQVDYPTGTLAYSYDSRGNNTKINYRLNGKEFAFTRVYDNANRLIEEVFPDGRKLTFQWDMAGNLISIPGKVEKIEYSEDGLMKYWQAANGVKTAYTFDQRQRPLSIDVGEGKILRLDYTYDANSNILTFTKTQGTTKTMDSYGYDSLYRLTQANLDDGQETITYGYDVLHNLTSKSSSLGSKSPVHMAKFDYDPNKLHALKQVDGRSLSYDKIGRTTQDGTKKYTWDYQHRRTEVKDGDNLIGRDWYGPDPRRLIKEENNLHTFYVSDHYEIREGKAIIYVSLGKNRVAAWSAPVGATQIIPDLAPATGDNKLTPQPDKQLTAADAWLYHAGKNKVVDIEVAKDPLSLDLTQDALQASLSRMLDGDQESTVYYHSDHLGSIRAVTNEKGEVLARKDYYPYGYLKKNEGSVYSPGFMGTERDVLTNTNRFFNRALDPKLARWQSPDPAFERITAQDDEFNSYGVVRANPIRYRDLDGTDSKDTMDALLWIGTSITLAIAFYSAIKTASTTSVTNAWQVRHRSFGVVLPPSTSS
ncbi:MAG: hypothetical protein H6728_01655 [Myxococcales bacterium]|nr:hypothetical protein [Myxococcales bacterium]